ncbi:tripartite tricarboxylate transporter substrate binding protein [Rhodobacteraceae bacterium RKSG542]|uniref:Bug family tripartite tricarboxylate transporter substrate binding protein n=1 Tax=Pseudovibrio flavus TaxID=2529854 RepID=UPI0012BCD449|nr:tripartite tricarboxylate transporter substrate binding protein [Pseudovibrio flavus]MTI15740.1 tripartite tricarboxylate transporter substrate binding protein [Pseudovibrio flavus]
MSVLKNTLIASMAVLASTAMTNAAEWKPEKPINLIVPWGAGGATDLVTRVVAGELESALGQKVVVVNQPGASGAIGSKAALDADRDGYTWTAGAAKDLGTYAVTGRLDTKIEDWHLFLSSANVNVISVNPDSKLADMGAFVDRMKDGKPIAVGTSGVNSAGHSAMESLVAATGGKYKHVTYEGGAKAVLSTVAGETEASSQLLTEQFEMLKGKRIRPLAALSTEPLELEGIGTVAPITQWLPEYNPTPIHFGIFVPKGVPAEVVATLEEIWSTKIKGSQALKDYANAKGSVVTVLSGEEAQKAVRPSIQVSAWQLFDGGQGKVSPEELGISRP